MSDWKAGFEGALVAYVLRMGTPMQAEGDTYYGWIAPDYEELRAHMENCTVAHFTYQDSAWVQFIGTFDEDEHRNGLDVTITCKCCQVTGRIWRYTGSYAQLIKAITEAA